MMSIALESNTSNRIDRSGFAHCMGIYNSSDSGRFSGDRRFSEGEREDEADSCSSSSIGRNSDSSDGVDGDSGDGEGEVQSSFKGPLNTLNALEEVLPIKRGISTFYSGKSKSFTSLAHAASCSSIKDIVKPEDAYTRKRKNMLAHSILWDKNRNFASISGSGGISKRLANSSRSTVALGLTMKRYEGNNNGESSNPNSTSSSPRLSLPPLPPNCRRSPNNESPESPPRRNFSPWRSFSLSDLQHATSATPTMTGSVIDERVEDDLY